jgi:hypothetical protein
MADQSVDKNVYEESGKIADVLKDVAYHLRGLREIATDHTEVDLKNKVKDKLMELDVDTAIFEQVKQYHTCLKDFVNLWNERDFKQMFNKGNDGLKARAVALRKNVKSLPVYEEIFGMIVDAQKSGVA